MPFVLCTAGGSLLLGSRGLCEVGDFNNDRALLLNISLFFNFSDRCPEPVWVN